MTPRICRSTVPAGARRVAFVTLFAFGCATVRVPASTMAGTVPVRGGVAEPQIELWVESGRKVSEAESAEASAKARAALESALARVSAPQGDAVLVVRAQGVARTPSRRADQRAAVAGLVVGAVVVVAAVVVLLVATHGKGGGASRTTPDRAAPAPRPPPMAVRPAPLPGRAAPGGPAIHVGVIAGNDVPPPGAFSSAEDLEAWPPQGRDPQVPAPDATAPAEHAAITLPPPPPLDLRDRGFFEGDTLRLELVVVDRRDGTPLWTKVVDGAVDPRDAHAVEQLLGDAVADGYGWIPAGAAGDPAAIR
ncbi:MAG TPA: hypothetical protein VIW03_05475 [Anaeromyxobacter sp.]